MVWVRLLRTVEETTLDVEAIAAAAQQGAASAESLARIARELEGQVA